MRNNSTYRSKTGLLLALTLAAVLLQAQTPDQRVRERDRRKDVEMITSVGIIRLRLSDATPIHRDNFIAFHRVIRGFMVQAGDPKSRDSSLRKPRRSTDSAYTIPAEIREDMFHRRGVLAAARMGDQVNPAKASSGTQFYIVQGRTFTDISLDSVETFRLNGRKIPPERRENYKKQGGAPHLDQAYTIFGEVIDGMETVDRIAAVNTTGRTGNDRPLEPIRILKTRLVKRKT
ncbi:MAG: peptidylprolyl isomerase [Chitinophagaceae bacterium]|nr:peptidylprolyl isomerase [Chitinophagaceae bacterium]